MILAVIDHQIHMRRGARGQQTIGILIAGDEVGVLKPVVHNTAAGRGDLLIVEIVLRGGPHTEADTTIGIPVDRIDIADNMGLHGDILRYIAEDVVGCEGGIGDDAGCGGCPNEVRVETTGERLVLDSAGRSVHLDIGKGKQQVIAGGMVRLVELDAIGLHQVHIPGAGGTTDAEMVDDGSLGIRLLAAVVMMDHQTVNAFFFQLPVGIV